MTALVAATLATSTGLDGELRTAAQDVATWLEDAPVITTDAATALDFWLTQAHDTSRIRTLVTLRICAEHDADTLGGHLIALADAIQLEGAWLDQPCFQSCERHLPGAHHCGDCASKVHTDVEERVSDLLTLMESVAPRATRELVRWDQTS